MAKVKITKRTVDALPVPVDRDREFYFDTVQRGFGVMVTRAGKKIFFFLYGDEHNRRRMRIDEFGKITVEMARERAEKLAAKVTNGLDPLNVKKTERERKRVEEGKKRKFGEWAAEYLAMAKEKRKSFKDYRYHLGRAIEAFGKKNLSEITPDMVKREFRRLTEKHSEIVANRWAATLRGCFTAAQREGLIEANPVAGLEKNHEREGRTRALSDAEYAALVKAIREHPNEYERAAFLMLTETGARLGEVLHAKWEDFDFDSLLWNMPETKAGHPQTIPIHEDLAAVLQSLPRDGLYVVRGKYPFKPRCDLKNAWAAVLKASGIDRATLHDLRRTFCVQVARVAGIHAASKILRHSDIRVTARHYAPMEAEEMREALKKRRAAVVQFKKKKAANQ